MIIVLNTLLLIGLAFLIYKSIKTPIRPAIFVTVLLLKIIAGCALAYLYIEYYGFGGDILRYHESASILANTARDDFDMFWKNFWQPFPEFAREPRAWVMVQLTAIFHIISDNNIWITSCWFSLFSFTGLYYFYSQARRWWPSQDVYFIFAFFLFPSALFWSSGIIKESISMGCIGFILGSYLAFFRKRSILSLISAVLFLYLLWLLKYYIAAVIILFLIPIGVGMTVNRAGSYKIIALVTLFTIILIAALHPNFYPMNFLDMLYESNQIFKAVSDPESYVQYPYNEKDYFFLILNAPFALLTSIFLPLAKFDNFPSVLASLENVLIVILFTGWLYRKGRNKEGIKNIEVIVLLYAALLAIFLGLSSPNLGTLSRYRVSFLPFLIWILSADNGMLEFNKEKFKKLWIKNR